METELLKQHTVSPQGHDLKEVGKKKPQVCVSCPMNKCR